ncbi:MAG: hypothetical protein ACREB9_04460 [Thermoplasmata archaeon]
MQADDDSSDLGHRPRSIAEMSLPRRLVFWGFATLLILGVLFYVWWGLSYGVWIDNGVYAVVVVLVLFGLAGMWLMTPNPPPPEELPPR